MKKWKGLDGEEEEDRNEQQLEDTPIVAQSKQGQIKSENAGDSFPMGRIPPGHQA